MKLSLALRTLVAWLLGLLCVAGIAHAQDVTVTGDGNTVVVNGRASNVIVPQSRSVVVQPGATRLGIRDVSVRVDVSQWIATTTFETTVFNPGSRVEEAEFLVPVPDDAVIRGFDFLGSALEPTAQLLPATEARATYDDIVSRAKDPALLEFTGKAVVRSSVFPVPANGEQRVRLVYETVLPRSGDRIDLELPRSESMVTSYLPWTVEVNLRSKTPISTVYSPTHEVAVDRRGPGDVRVTLSGREAQEPGPVRISYLLQTDGVGASVFAYPDPTIGGGYFLLLAGLPVTFSEEDLASMEREVVFVLDRSGSMNGEKFEQARAAALQVLEGLNEGERFNIVDYSSDVASFRSAPVEKTPETLAAARDYLGRLRSGGGTALHTALVEALRQDHEAGTIPIVLFLTDGLPTIGVTDEVQIRDNAEEVNLHGRRVFTVGVGNDVNVPLLDRLADASRATSEYVQPGEDVEEKVSEVFARLQGPVLAEPRLTFTAEGDVDAGHLVSDLVPPVLPDLYEGDRVLVLGKYRGEGPPRVRFEGEYLGEPKAFPFQLDLSSATVANGFVPRLWATRKVASLVEEIRQAGADPALAVAGAARDPHLTELAEEILALSTEFGVLTEYTAFLALEGTDLSDHEVVLARLDQNLLTRAQRARVGRAALNQSTNQRVQLRQDRLNRLNRFFDENMEEREVTNLRQVGDRTFFRRQGTWVDARLLERGPDVSVDRAPAFASTEHRELTARLSDEHLGGVHSLAGPVVIEVDGEAVRLPRPAPVAGASAPAAAATGGASGS